MDHPTISSFSYLMAFFTMPDTNDCDVCTNSLIPYRIYYRYSRFSAKSGAKVQNKNEIFLRSLKKVSFQAVFFRICPLKKCINSLGLLPSFHFSILFPLSVISSCSLTGKHPAEHSCSLFPFFGCNPSNCIASCACRWAFFVYHTSTDSGMIRCYLALSFSVR